MSLICKFCKSKPERMANWHFKFMNVCFHIIDFVYPYIDKRVQKFGIEPGMTVVDYGCGPGRYTTRLAKLVGEQGNHRDDDGGQHQRPIDARGDRDDDQIGAGSHHLVP